MTYWYYIKNRQNIILIIFRVRRQITPEFEKSKTLKNNFVTTTGDNYIDDYVDTLDEVEFKFNKSHDPKITKNFIYLLNKYLLSVTCSPSIDDSYF